jgi:hypothetical protein
MPRGEVAELKDNINTMIDNLRLTTERNTEQDWLKTNLARFTNMLQGSAISASSGAVLLSELTPLVGRAAGRDLPEQRRCRSTGRRADAPAARAYADDGRNGHPTTLRVGEGLVGQCALDKRRMLLTDLPPSSHA